MIPDTDLPDYYARRAGEYEKIYTKPERQADLASLRIWLREQLTGHAVLEVACGTGYWTQAICASAESIVATDINEQVLDIARHKTYTRDKVEFRIADAYTPGGLSGDFTAGFSGFLGAHVSEQGVLCFLVCFPSKMRRNCVVRFFAHKYGE